MDWQAYAALEPFGEDREDLRMGILAATIANGLQRVCDMLVLVNRGTLPPHKPAKPSDFIPVFDRLTAPAQAGDVRSMIALFRQATLARGGTVITAKEF